MTPARWSWTTVVLICILAAALVAINGYSGYAITLGAVGLAAAINLL